MLALLARLKYLTPEGDVLVTKLENPPVLMSSPYLPIYMSGKICEIRIFSDGGHSCCLLETGIPEELWDCLTKHGPHALRAVGATTVYGGSAWAYLPLATGLSHTPFDPLGRPLHTTTTLPDTPADARMGLALA